MSNNSRLISLFFIIMSFTNGANAAVCNGGFPNLITDICWSCMFPVQIGGIKITTPNQRDNSDPPPPFICNCPAPPPIFQRVGVGVSFWEPARLSEVVRTPLCSPTVGTVLGTLPAAPAGTHFGPGEEESAAFYQAHWLSFPVLSWLGMSIASGACFVSDSFDYAYMTEFDPLWGDDELAFILNPEAILFANPIAQAACVADSIKASATFFGIDSLFWCSGSQGSIYPLSGNHAPHIGGVDSSLAITHIMTAKIHRELLGFDTSTEAAMCESLPQPILRKTQYKQQMLRPIPNPVVGLGYGSTSVWWAAGKEFPYAGEDFSYLVWRKRKCCAL